MQYLRTPEKKLIFFFILWYFTNSYFYLIVNAVTSAASGLKVEKSNFPQGDPTFFLYEHIVVLNYPWTSFVLF